MKWFRKNVCFILLDYLNHSNCLSEHIGFDQTDYDLLKVQFSELEVECAAYKQDYENALSEIELLKVERENAIAQLNQFRHSISTKLTDVLISEGLVEGIVQ
jgi:hypothetical protein